MLVSVDTAGTTGENVEADVAGGGVVNVSVVTVSREAGTVVVR